MNYLASGTLNVINHVEELVQTEKEDSSCLKSQFERITSHFDSSIIEEMVDVCIGMWFSECSVD